MGIENPSNIASALATLAQLKLLEQETGANLGHLKKVVATDLVHKPDPNALPKQVNPPPTK